MDPNFLAFLISLGAGATWDGLKKLLSKKNFDDQKRQLMMAIVSTMRDFYLQMNFEYEERIVMDCFLSAIHEYKDLKWHFRDVIEYIIGYGIDDEQFQIWVDIYAQYAPWEEKPFVRRNDTLTRIKNKLCIKDEHSYGDYFTIINNVCGAFNYSWKQEVIEKLSPLDIDLSIFNRPERYDVLLSYCNNLDIEDDQLENVKSIQDLLEHPHFNKVLLVCGKSGSGKSHFIKTYTREAHEGFGHIPVPCYVHLKSVETIFSDIIESLHSFLQIKCASLEEYSYLLDALSIRICFVIEDIDIFLNDNWDDVVFAIVDSVRFDSYTFIISINEYEYYQLEKDQSFLEKYCVKIFEQSFFGNCFSIDEFNNSQNVIRKILVEEYGVSYEFGNELSTPQEAIYYGMCAREEREVAPPSSYYDFIERITRWKEKQVASAQLMPILNAIIKQKSSVIQIDSDVLPFRKAQLLTQETQQSVYSIMPAYHLRIYPYWATKIIVIDSEGILSYSEDLREWLVSSFIFYRYQEEKDKKIDLGHFFKELQERGILEYAVFCAYKADVHYKRALCRFLLNIEIDKPRLCYAILRFVDQCAIVFSDKLSLCSHIAKLIDDYGLLELYSRTLDRILEQSKNIESLRRNMLSLVGCSVQNFNHVNGYRFGNRYMILSQHKKVYDLVWVIVQYIRNNQLEEIIAQGNNISFLDYFLRKCFEYYIMNRHEELIDIYIQLNSIFLLPSGVGGYIKRNLTCAAGNVFAGWNDPHYRSEYIRTTQHFMYSSELFDRLTAWFLVSNSISEQKKIIDEKLLDVLDVLMADSEVVEKVGNEMDRFLKDNM